MLASSHPAKPSTAQHSALPPATTTSSNVIQERKTEPQQHHRHSTAKPHSTAQPHRWSTTITQLFTPHMGQNDKKTWEGGKCGRLAMYGTEKSLPVCFKGKPKNGCRFFTFFLQLKKRPPNGNLGLPNFQGPKSHRRSTGSCRQTRSVTFKAATADLQKLQQKTLPRAKTRNIATMKPYANHARNPNGQSL